MVSAKAASILSCVGSAGGAATLGGVRFELIFKGDPILIGRGPASREGKCEEISEPKCDRLLGAMLVGRMFRMLGRVFEGALRGRTGSSGVSGDGGSGPEAGIAATPSPSLSPAATAVCLL